MMNQVRYTQCDCQDTEKREAFLSRARIGVLGMAENSVLYAVPVNFVWYKGAIWFHGMGSGKKVDLLARNPSVCFTVFEEYGTVTDPVPCHADTAYLSVMIFGKAERITDFSVDSGALHALISKYMPGFYRQTLSPQFIEKYRSGLDGNGVAVYRLLPEEITAKENVAVPDALFHDKLN